MASFQTSPERRVQSKAYLPRWLLRCLWGWLTSKPSLKVVRRPRVYRWKKLLDFLEGRSFAVNTLNSTREMKVWTNTPASERIWRQYLFSFSLVIWTIWSAKLSVVSGCTGIPSQATMRMLCCLGWHRCGGSRRRSAYLYVKYVQVFRAARMGYLSLIRAKFTDSVKKSYKVRSSCSHSAWIVFSMDFLQTSPEWGVHNKTQLLCLLRCLWGWMTSKQSLKAVQGPKDYNCKFSLSLLKAKSLSFHSLTWIKPDRWKSGWMQPQVSAFDSSICLVSAFHALEEEFQNLISDGPAQILTYSPPSFSREVPIFLIIRVVTTPVFFWRGNPTLSVTWVFHPTDEGLEGRQK